jgi:hypothetical protein
MRAAFPAHFILLDLTILIILGERIQVVEFFAMQLSLTSCHVISLRCKYSQHPVLIYPYVYVLRLKSETTRKITVLCILIFTYLDSRLQKIILNWMVASITRIHYTN